ncbi:MAG TPA: hypothetical protein DHU78_00295 [Opitutae bacterium]|nr:hypothetical protein [Opitutae bacterium]
MITTYLLFIAFYTHALTELDCELKSFLIPSIPEIIKRETRTKSHPACQFPFHSVSKLTFYL